MVPDKAYCSVCIRECEKGKSFCHRRNGEGSLVGANRYCAVTVDHLFDKPVIYFRQNFRLLSLGSWGCNFRCPGCQNAALSWSATGEGLICAEMEAKEIVDLARENDCRGICYTFNEPAILLEVVEETASRARIAGLYNIFVTNCTLTEKSVKRIARHIDAVAADIKSLNDDFYYVYCGAGGIYKVASRILACILAFQKEGCHVEVRTNIIPGANDRDEELRDIADWIRVNMGPETPWHITRFFPAHQLSRLGQTSASSLLKAQRIGLDEGLKHVHTFFSKGCDCAKNTYFVGSDAQSGKLLVHSCCK